MTHRTLLQAGTVALALVCPNAFAYEEMEVTDAGSIHGVVRFTGKDLPKNPTIHIPKDMPGCPKRPFSDQTYVISREREIQNVVVQITDIKKGTFFPEKRTRLNNVDCMFVPRVSIGFKGGQVELTNSDDTLHNVHPYLKQRTLFNVALPQRNKIVTRKLEDEGVLKIACDMHAWMRGYIYVVDHPYAVVTNGDGEFFLWDVPPGQYHVETFHEAFGTLKTIVDVTPDKTTEIEFAYPSGEKASIASGL